MENNVPIPLSDRRTVPRPSWAVGAALIFAGTQLAEIGLVLMCAGIALLLDSVVVLWRCRGLTCSLSIPSSGRVGTPTNFQIKLEAASEATITARVGVTATGGEPRDGWIQQSGEAVDAPITPSHRGRFSHLRVAASHRGVFGLDVLRHDFFFEGPPALAIGPVNVAHANLQAAQVDAPVQAKDDVSSVSAAEPVLRPWQRGDRTSSIDWRRFERLDELVVRSSPNTENQIIIVCNLGTDADNYERADHLAGQWSSLARHHLTSSRVVLVWHEQHETHAVTVAGVDDIDWVLAGAMPGHFDAEVLEKLGIDPRTIATDE